MLLILLLFASFAITFPLGKIALNYSSPLYITFFRMTLAGLLLLGGELLSKKKNKGKGLFQNFPQTLKEWSYIFYLGFLAHYLSNYLELIGLKNIHAAKACFIYSMSPFFSAILSYFFFKEKMTLMKIIGMIIATAGMYPLLSESVSDEQTLNHFFILSSAEIMVFLACFFAALGWIITKKALNSSNLNLKTLNGMSMLVAGILSFFHSYETEYKVNDFFVSNWPLFFFWIALFILISNILSHNLYGHLLRKYGATLLSLAGLTTPLFAAIWSYLLLGETVTMPFFVSFFFVITGLGIFYRGDIQK